MAAACAGCGKKIGVFSTVEVENQKFCDKCAKAAKAKIKEDRQQRKEITPDQTQGVIVTTTPSLEGHKVEEYVSVINSQVVLGVDAWRDMMGSVRSWWGGRAKGLEKELQAGFVLALDDLKKEAVLVGANAVIGVEFDGGMEVAGDVGSNDKMMVVTATGTAVKVRKQQ